MYRKIYYFFGILCLILSLGLILNILINPDSLINFILRSAPKTQDVSEEYKEMIDNLYDISFAFPKKNQSSFSLYIPEYDFIDAEQASMYLNFFDLKGDFSEDDNFYIFTSDTASLFVNKYYNRIMVKYNKNYESLEAVASLLSDIEAVDIALEYIENCLLPIGLYELEVVRSENTITVTFYEKLSGILNYSHPVIVKMDLYGNILELDYFRLIYEQLSDTNIISMREAYYRLPLTDSPLLSEYYLDSELDALKIDLNKCTLVYYFEDSILQPAYLFEGEIMNTDEKDSNFPVKFRQLINAALYQ